MPTRVMLAGSGIGAVVVWNVGVKNDICGVPSMAKANTLSCTLSEARPAKVKFVVNCELPWCAGQDAHRVDDIVRQKALRGRNGAAAAEHGRHARQGRADDAPARGEFGDAVSDQRV